MAHTTSSDGAVNAPRGAIPQDVQPTEMSGWVGWIAFAGLIMVMLGVFHVIEGFIALFQDQYFHVARSGLTIHVDYSVWGWTHIIGGVLILAAGIGLFSGRIWARSIAVVLAMISSVVNIAFLSAYPIWSVIMITLDVLVIWAVTVHGSELKK